MNKTLQLGHRDLLVVFLGEWRIVFWTVNTVSKDNTMREVIKSVFLPILALAKAASIPACPAPTTITS